jgi:hypothetical protein
MCINFKSVFKQENISSKKDLLLNFYIALTYSLQYF